MGMEYSTETAGPSSSGEPDASPAVLVISGPSGVGKGTLIDLLMTENSESFGFSVSHTTRSPRDGEQNGVHYHFTSKEDFEKGIACGKFLEYAAVHGNLYGTSVDAVNAVLNKGKCCILDIDVQGAKQVRKSEIGAIFVFIAPPSEEELEQRLRNRGKDSEEQIRMRLRTAKDEIASLQEPGLFDFSIVNKDLSDAYTQLKGIALAAKDGRVPSQQDEQKDLAQSSVLEGVSQQAGEAASSAAGDQRLSPGAGSFMPGMEKWRGKVALVTGASSGIGWAVSVALCTSGVRVIAVARRRERLEKLQQEIINKGVPASEFLPVVCDATKEPEVVALPKIVAKRWPDAGIDILINNAGLSRSSAGLFDGEMASWVEMLSTNVLGVCMCTREVVQNMKQRGNWGHIINVSSLSGHRVPIGAGGGGFYAATKHAVRALTEGLRQEARDNKVPLRVSCISPGVVETEFYTVANFGDADKAKEAYRKFKCLTPEDIGQSILWILSAPEHMEVNDVLLRPTEQLF